MSDRDPLIWELSTWPWGLDGVRLLPVLHERLEFARAVRAHLDHFDPQAVVVEIPKPATQAWLSAVTRLPVIHAVRFRRAAGELSWLIVDPCDATVEAARWALERGRAVICGDLWISDYPRMQDALPDPAVIPEIGYAPFVRAALAATRPHAAHDGAREQAIAVAIAQARAAHDRVVAVFGVSHLQGITRALREGAASPAARVTKLEIVALPLDPECLVEVLGETPFVQAAFERARTGQPPCAWSNPVEPRPVGKLLRFPGAAEIEPAQSDSEEELALETRAKAQGDDLLSRPRLLSRLIDHAIRHTRQSGSSGPSLGERRVLHTFARNLALLDGRLCPDLFELTVAARGAVDDRFARDLLRVAGHWPWQGQPAGAVRLTAQDLGRGTRLITLRPRIDRIGRRPQLRQLLRSAEERLAGASAICSHEPEDLIVEALGRELRERGRRRAARAGERVVPFTASLLDGLDPRETLRRMLTDGRPWVREETRARSQAGAVVVIFDEDDQTPEHFPYRQVWHGEHENESDLAFYSTAPDDGVVAPGIRRADYGGLLMTWPPRRLGEVWSDPDYAEWARNKPERLLVAALDYAREPLVVVAARSNPRAELHELARRIGKRIVHLPLGTIAGEQLRRIRTFHILAGRELRPIARRVIDPIR
ncbi:MAG: hypothetical protein U0V87_00445 [Acidobacteriota bacterium]